MIAVEGDTVAMLAATQTLANKTLTTPNIGTPSAGTLTNCTGLPASGIGSGTIATARLGSGSASSSTYLRGDQTWASISSGTADDYDVVTASPTSTYQATGLTGHTVIKLALGGNTTISPPTSSTFGASKRFFVQYELTATGAQRTPSFSSHTVTGGVTPNLVIASGDTLQVTTYTDDNGSTFLLQGDLDISKLGTATEASGDYYLGMDASASNVQVRFPVILAASETVVGKVELATAAEVNAGTDATRAVHPDGLAASYAGTKAISIPFTAQISDNHATGDGQAGFLVPPCMNGMNLVSVLGVVATAGTTGTGDYQFRRVRAGSSADMLSTKLTIDSTELTSATAATAAVINTSNDDLATGDIIYLDVDAVQSTPAKGGFAVLEFRLP